MGAPALVKNVTLLAAILAAHVAVAGATPPSEQFRAALRSSDGAALARLGSELGHDSIAAVITGDDRVAAIAATRAAPACSDGWALLAPLATAARARDRALALAAARAAATIANGLDGELVELHDIPVDLLDEALAGWQAIGASQHRWADVRVLALVVSSRLAALTGADAGFAIDLLIVDDEPEVRRAALELLPALASSAQHARVAARLRDDPDDVVAAVAGHILCEGLTGAGDPQAVLTALDDAASARLRALVVNGALPATALLGCARCLAAASGSANLTALRHLASKGPRTIRRRVRRMLSKTK